MGAVKKPQGLMVGETWVFACGEITERWDDVGGVWSSWQVPRLLCLRTV